MAVDSCNIQYVNSLKGSIRPNAFVNLVLASLLVSFAFTPILLRNVPDLLKLAVFGLWAFTGYAIPKPSGIRMPRKIAFWWGFYAIWLFGMCIIGHSDVSINFFIIRIPLYGIPFMMVVAVGKYNLEEKLLLWKILLVVFSVNLFFNLLVDPATYDHLDALDATASDKLTNAGGTAFVTMCMFMIPIMWVVNRNTTHSKKKVLSIAVIVPTLFHMTVQNNRATATIVLLIMLVSFWVVSRVKETSKSHKRLVVFVLLLLILLFIFIVPILQAFLSLFEDSARMTDRINDLLSVSEGEDIDTDGKGSLGQRYLLWMTSINTFFSSIPHFLFGIGQDSHQYDLFSLLKCGVGEHSEFFDLAAKYGLAGIVIVYMALSHTFSYFKAINQSFNVRKMVNVIIIGFLIYSTFNGTFNEPTLHMILIFLPLTLVLLNNKVI